MTESARTAPRHVAHVIGTLRTGGAERQLVNYLLAADTVDFRHTVICLSARGELADLVEGHGIPVVVMPVRWRAAPAALLGFRAWLRRHEVAVVHAHMHGAALWGRLAGRLAGVPALVTTEHGKELWKSRWRVAVDRFLSGWTARHICVSEDGRNIRLRRERVRPDRLIVIPNGVAVPATVRDPGIRRRIRTEFGLKAEQPVMATVGRVVEAKGYPHLVEAFAKLRVDWPELHWLQVGMGPDAGALAAAAQAAGVAEAMTMAGNRPDVADILQAVDLWVMSSLREGLSVALLEAMAAACPIVATEVGGTPDAVTSGHEGLLVPPADPQALADAVDVLLRDPDRAAALGAAARGRVQREYAIDTVARRIENVYREALGHGTRSTG